MTILMRPKFVLAALMILAGSIAFTAVEAGQRETIPMTASEREKLLAGMRIYLESIEAIIAALASNRVDKAAAGARRSGKALLKDVDPSSALTVPMSFTIFSIDTHEKFDALAEKAAARAPKSEILDGLSAVLSNCTGCHAAFRIVPAK